MFLSFIKSLINLTNAIVVATACLPELVAKYLYTNQGEGRFGFEPRLFIINLKDEYQKVEEIEEISKNINFGDSLLIDFKYKGVKYKTDAIVVFV